MSKMKKNNDILLKLANDSYKSLLDDINSEILKTPIRKLERLEDTLLSTEHALELSLKHAQSLAISDHFPRPNLLDK